MINRLAHKEVEEALTDTPVVLIHGPRQCGKSTLAKQFANDGERRYISFDNPRILAEAKADPLAFLETYDEPLIIDKLMGELATKYADRASGYTRIVKIGPRLGDAAAIVQIELV